MSDSKRFTVCCECKHYVRRVCQPPMCSMRTYIHPVYGEMCEVGPDCADKNKGDCPDFVAKDAGPAGGRCAGVFMEAARKAFGLT